MSKEFFEMGDSLIDKIKALNERRTMTSYRHTTLSLNEKDSTTLEALKEKKYTIVEIFRMGMEEAIKQIQQGNDNG